MAYISRMSDVSMVSCRFPNLCCETQRSMAVNVWAQTVQGIVWHVLSQHSVKDTNREQRVRPGNLPRFIPWQEC